MKGDVGQISAGRRQSGRVLFLAQVPPPVHGVTTISARVLETLRATPDVGVEHLWMGAARSIGDVGRLDAGKILAFGWLLLRLTFKFLSGSRYTMTYQTLAPHGDAALRDGLVILFSKLLAPRVLVHLHTRGLEEVLAGRDWRARLMRLALHGTELIAISQAVAVAAQSTGHFAKVHRLPNFVADGGWSQQRRAGPLRCGWLGNYDPRKGVLRFVATIAAMRAEGCDVYGEIAGGPTKYLSKRELEDYVAAQGCEAFVNVRGFVSGSDKDDWFDSLDLFIYPTEHDLAPLVVLEAMAHGVVPIVYDTGALREMLGAAFAGYVVARGGDAARDIAEITDIALRLASSETSLAAERKRVRAHYEGQFTADRFANGLRALAFGRSESADANGTIVSTAKLQVP
jgi:glycosyltransferase involved in cell wall biosynthesis